MRFYNHIMAVQRREMVINTPINVGIGRPFTFRTLDHDEFTLFPTNDGIMPWIDFIVLLSADYDKFSLLDFATKDGRVMNELIILTDSRKKCAGMA